MRYFSRFYKGRQDTITILNRNPLNLYRGPTPLSQHQTIEGAVRAAYRDARQNGNATYRVRVDGGNYVRFSITLPDRGAIQASTQVGLDVALVLGAPWQPPVVSSTPTPSFTEGTPSTYDFSDNVTRTGLPEGFDYPITYSLNGTLDPSLSLAAATGVLTYDGSAGTTYSLTLTVTDAQGADTSDSFDMTITAIDTAPTVSTPSLASFTEGIAADRPLAPYVTDDGYSPVVYSINGALPGGVTLAASTGILSYNGIALADTRSVTFTATDDVGSDTSGSFDVVVVVAPVGADADFAHRASSNQVQWMHNFLTDEEITRFLWVGGEGNDPGRVTAGCQRVTFDTTDFVSGGGSIKILTPAGSENSGSWIRQLAPVDDSGRGVADKGWEAGDLTWNPVQGNDSTNTFIQNVAASGYGPGDLNNKRHMFLQYACKFDSRRELASEGGKIHYLSKTTGQVVSQELVWGYKSRGGPPLNHFVYAGAAYNNSGNWSAFQEVSNEQNSETDIIYDEWQTFLFEFVAGDEYDDGIGTGPMSQHRAWRQRPGEVEYTLVWEAQQWDDSTDKSFALDYQNTHNKTINVLIFNHLLNSISNPQDIETRYDEVILSHGWIPPKATFSTSVLQSARDSLVGGAGDYDIQLIPMPTAASGHLITRWDISWQGNAAYWDDMRRELHIMGKAQSGGAATHWIYKEETNTWRVTKEDIAPGKLGHIWGHAFDHTVNPGTYYFIEQDAEPNHLRTIRYCDRVVENGLGTGAPTAWTQLPDATYDITAAGDQDNIMFHPNLLGPGKPGLMVIGDLKRSIFDLNNQVWIDTGSPINGSYQNFRGSNVYVPGHDALMVGNGEGSVGTIRMGAGLNASQDTYSCPINLRSGTGNNGKIIVDPRDDSRVLVFEAIGTNVWSSPDLGQTWIDETAVNGLTHPFHTVALANNWKGPDGGSWTLASLPRQRCVIGLYSYNPATILWKEGD